MIALIMIIAWMLPSLYTYRRLGYVWNAKMFEGHSYQSICDTCRCKNCGSAKEYHKGHGRHYYYSGCDDYEPAGKHHVTPILATIPVAIVAWPALVAWYGVSYTRAAMGLEPGSFFTPPPKIETKQEKQERKMLERELEIAAREKAISAKELELGIK